MSAAFTKKYSEDSKGGRLKFSFFCDICHEEYVSPSVEGHPEKGLFQKWKMQKAYETAFEEAQETAKEHFNYCPLCNCWVCDECFRILPDGDICKECAENSK